MKKWLITGTVVVFIGILAANWLASNFYLQADLTQEQRYSMAKETKQLLRNVEQPVEVFVFLESDQLPSAFKRLQQETRTLLRQFEQESNGQISFKFEDPIKNLTAEERQNTILELQERGISPTNVRVKTKSGFSENLVFPGALINFGEKQFPVQLLSGQRGQEDLNRSIELLEYRFANAIAKLQRDNIATVGFLQGHGELSPQQSLDLRQTLGDNFVRSRAIDLTVDTLLPQETPLLIVAKPTAAFSEADKFQIDQYIMHGGKVIFAIDAMKMELDSLKTTWGGRNVAVDYPLNLDDQLFKYGLRINKNLVRDLQSKPIPIIVDDTGQSELMPWTFYPVVSADQQHITTKNVSPISFEFVSSIDTLSIPGINTTVMLESSANTGLVANPVLVDLEELRNPPRQGAFTQQNLPLAVLLEGQFTSLYQYRSAQIDYPLQRQDQSTQTSICVISDGDILKNEILPNGETLPLGYDRGTGEQFGNKEFMMNLIDYMLDPYHPLQARNKEFQIRLLNQTKVDQQRANWQFMSIALPLILLAVLGVLFHVVRKRRFTT